MIANDYHVRRKRLMERLPDNAIVICMAGNIRLMSQSTCLLEDLFCG